MTGRTRLHGTISIRIHSSIPACAKHSAHARQTALLLVSQGQKKKKNMLGLFAVFACFLLSLSSAQPLSEPVEDSQGNTLTTMEQVNAAFAVAPTPEELSLEEPVIIDVTATQRRHEQSGSRDTLGLRAAPQTVYYDNTQGTPGTVPALTLLSVALGPATRKRSALLLAPITAASSGPVNIITLVISNRNIISVTVDISLRIYDATGPATGTLPNGPGTLLYSFTKTANTLAARSNTPFTFIQVAFAIPANRNFFAGVFLEGQYPGTSGTSAVVSGALGVSVFGPAGPTFSTNFLRFIPTSGNTWTGNNPPGGIPVTFLVVTGQQGWAFAYDCTLLPQPCE